MPPNPNDTLSNGQTRSLRLLGRGGFGFVYQAQDTLMQAICRTNCPSPGKGHGLVMDSAGAFDDVEGLAREVSLGEILADGANLSIRLYVSPVGDGNGNGV